MKISGPFPEYRLSEHLLARPRDILAFGGSKLEMIIPVPGFPGGGGQQAANIPLPYYTPGGCATNVACFAGRIGAAASVVTRAGSGFYGQRVWDEYAVSHVDTTYARQLAGHEGDLLIIMTDPQGDWFVLSYLDPDLELRVEDIPPVEVMRQFKAVYIDGFAFPSAAELPAMDAIIERGHQAGCLVVTDAAVPTVLAQPQVAANICRRCDIVYANEDEALGLTGTATIDDAIEALREMGITLTFVKLGAAGSLIVGRDRIGEVPTYPITLVDTISAGDAYVAATLTGLCHGDSLALAAHRGSAAGALACTSKGSLSARFTLADLDRVIAAHSSGEVQ